MLQIIKSNVLAPLATRMGTLASGGLLAVDATQQQANDGGTAVAVLLLIGMDLGLAWLRKQAIIKKALASVGLGTLP